MPTSLNLIFHGPWGFAWDTNPNSNTLTALTPRCEDHEYWMANGSVWLPMPSGSYAFTDDSGLAPQGGPPDPNAKTVQTILGPNDVPPRLAVPSPSQHPGVYCRFVLPPTQLQPLFCMTRSEPVASIDSDNLLSGRHFRLLTRTSKQQTASLALAQLITYQVNTQSPVVLFGDGGGPPVVLDQQGADINLHIFAEAPEPSAEDHFAMMAALFNLDLHLDGPGLLANADFDTQAPPAGLDLAQLKSLEAARARWLARTRGPAAPAASAPRRSRFPNDKPACGFGVVILYDSSKLIAPSS